MYKAISKYIRLDPPPNLVIVIWEAKPVKALEKKIPIKTTILFRNTRRTRNKEFSIKRKNIQICDILRYYTKHNITEVLEEITAINYNKIHNILRLLTFS
ncbi:Hypothetical predicted protein [Octopus vulgaris]|uniref:Uncharacterized protein n=1 Tax=Octopus vulgaris TaxID=6645 RepID=A0AA36BI48_OCTVU|nr:Hypothetical predicted protein [Octopus vulgaris]